MTPPRAPSGNRVLNGSWRPWPRSASRSSVVGDRSVGDAAPDGVDAVWRPGARGRPLRAQDARDRRAVLGLGHLLHDVGAAVRSGVPRRSPLRSTAWRCPTAAATALPPSAVQRQRHRRSPSGRRCQVFFQLVGTGPLFDSARAGRSHRAAAGRAGGGLLSAQFRPDGGGRRTGEAHLADRVWRRLAVVSLNYLRRGLGRVLRRRRRRST